MSQTRPVVACVRSVACLVLGLSFGLACKEQGSESTPRASRDVAQLAGFVDKDVAEIERGLPDGAKQLAPLVANGADPRQDIAGVRRALLRVRREVMDLNVAKSTFFALADPSGVAIRNDLEEDVMAGQNVITIFPVLAKARDGFVTATGIFPNASTKNGPDKDWIAGTPVKRADGSTGALFLTGWTYRYYSRHLQESLKSPLLDEAKAAGNEGKLPVYYVAVFDKTGVYPAPTTPQVDEKALADLDLVAKTAAGSIQGSVNITDRVFGYAATRTPKLAPDTGIVELRSEL
jgi:hypothetical protein